MNLLAVILIAQASRIAQACISTQTKAKNPTQKTKTTQNDLIKVPTKLKANVTKNVKNSQINKR